MTNYQKGANRERKIVNHYREQGFLAFRSAGSHSEIDVFILDRLRKEIQLIQCKPDSMSKPARERLLETLKRFEGTYTVQVKVI